ncbi:MAG: hypothetical protein ABW101_19295 [Candidatus Thiodiazotropha sp.]
MEILTYSRRLLAPFQGVQQIVAVPGGIAETMDGRQWKLYVHDDAIVSHTGLSEVVYGSWDDRQGLSRSRIRGSLPSRLIETLGERLVRTLTEQSGNIPYRPRDRFESWLLDETGEPLALLESALPEDPRIDNNQPAWYPDSRANRHFSSPHGNAEQLTELVRLTAGKRPLAVWIERKPDGGGSDEAGTDYSPERFPPLLLREDWSDPKQQALIRDFLDWQSPWLLQLPLTSEMRQRLEPAAWRRPRETSRVYRLFPRVCDPSGLTTTRVKARLMQDRPGTRQVSEPFYPFVNE